MRDICLENLQRFIMEEKAYFATLSTGIIWDDTLWNIGQWLFHRGNGEQILFNTFSSKNKLTNNALSNLTKGSLPSPFSDFTKAVAVNLQRTKKIGYMAVRNYVNECRRIHIFMHNRGESCPTLLTRWHFERTVEFLQEIQYKNIYDASANLKVIADLVDKKQLTPYQIEFINVKSPERSNHSYQSITDIVDDEERKGDEKLPSYEAMQAYAICTNNPIDENEEILLRTIDLLIAMGQRGNEVALLPYDCWVEKSIVDSAGNSVKDATGNNIIKIGIRYYPEKNFQARVHWLADQDINFARRAVQRLELLTKGVREVAKWQEEHLGRLWTFEPDQLIEDNQLIQILGFKHTHNLFLYLKRNNICPARIDHNKRNPLPRNRTMAAHFYKAGEIERLLLPKLSDHVALKEKSKGNWKILLKTSEVLSIRFDGAYRFKERGANIFKVFPGRTELQDINSALGAVAAKESIFDRRDLKEADGSRIVLTSHQPRHWRNTLYELAGMSNVQQALALGRQRLDQNPTYQHTTLAERTQLHKDFISFTSPAEKVSFLHSGIKSKQILGDITDTYHLLRADKGVEKADTFLKTHALAIHLTPFGGCTHDFSQAPCTKHLQCWNGCSHLHRTNTPGETERIEEQFQLSKQILEKMRADGDGDYGTDVWVQDLEKKVKNLEMALAMTVQGSPTPVFPDGVPVTIPEHMKKGSSVSE